tara:strand:+ start:44 stop:241 length:198 start_codon:yes stop_codon:yes gene_type:complete
LNENKRLEVNNHAQGGGGVSPPALGMIVDLGRVPLVKNLLPVCEFVKEKEKKGYVAIALNRFFLQ